MSAAPDLGALVALTAAQRDRETEYWASWMEAMPPPPQSEDTRPTGLVSTIHARCRHMHGMSDGRSDLGLYLARHLKSFTPSAPVHSEVESN